MKKIALVVSLALTSSTVLADTYFRFGGTHAVSNVAAEYDAQLIKGSAPLAGLNEELDTTEFTTQSIVLGVGQDFNDYISGELRYKIAGGSSVNSLGKISSQENIFDDEINASYEDSIDGVFSERMEIKEQNRFDGLLLLKTPEVFSLQPYLMAGYSHGNISVGKVKMSSSGFTYGGGLNVNFSEKWALSAEYQLYPEISGSEYDEVLLTKKKENSNQEGEEAESPKSDESAAKVSTTVNSTYDSSRVNLTLTYRF